MESEANTLEAVDARAWTRSLRIKLAIVILVAVVMAVLVSLHVHGVNGPWYWKWHWRRLDVFPLFPAAAIAIVPIVAAQFVRSKHPTRGKWLPIVLLMLGMLAMEIATMIAQPGGLARVREIVEHADITSYYTNAVVLFEQGERGIGTAEWLMQYPEIMPLLHLHAKYKPPGLVLYYLAFIEMFGKGHLAAAAGGWVIGVLATLGVPGTYWLVKTYASDDDAAFCAASFYSLCPAPILFWPQFDQIYPPMACAMLALWGLALMRGKVGFAIAFGAAMSVALFMSYIFLVLGLFLAVFSLMHVAGRGGAGAKRVIVHAAAAVGTVVVLYGLLSMLTGFDPIATFRSAAASQVIDLLPLARPFPLHIVFDFVDFAMAAGWIAFVLVAFCLMKKSGRRTPRRRLVFLSLLQIVVTGLAALLPGETARLWMLLLPLLMAPIGIELSRWPLGARLIVLAMLWMSTLVIAQNMIFANLGRPPV